MNQGRVCAAHQWRTNQCCWQWCASHTLHGYMARPKAVQGRVCAAHQWRTNQCRRQWCASHTLHGCRRTSECDVTSSRCRLRDGRSVRFDLVQVSARSVWPRLKTAFVGAESFPVTLNRDADARSTTQPVDGGANRTRVDLGDRRRSDRRSPGRPRRPAAPAP